MPTEPKHLLIFPVLIQISNIEGVETLNEKLCKSIYELKETEPNSKPDTWACDVYTTIMSGKMLLDNPPFDALGQIILAEVTTYARAFKLDIDKYPLKINECWVNVYGRGDAQDTHNHPNSVISGIYYPKAPEGCGDVLFHSPLADQMLNPPTTEPTSVNWPLFVVKPISGLMVLFRSWLKHSVKPNRTIEDRISISFNVTM